jgi:hypothetical protein
MGGENGFKGKKVVLDDEFVEHVSSGNVVNQTNQKNQQHN